MSAVNGSIMWDQNEAYIPADSTDFTEALLSYVSLLSLYPPFPPPPALISNETNYDPYEQVSAVNGSIMWAQNEAYIPADSADFTEALLSYVSLLSLYPCPLPLQL